MKNNIKIKSLMKCLLILPVLTGLSFSQVVDHNEDAKPVVAKERKIDEKINDFMAPISNEIFKYVFAGPKIENAKGEQLKYKNGNGIELPLILIWLIGTSLLLTFIFKFVNLTHLKLAFNTIRGKYSQKDDPGEITHFQALSAALSGTVGLGNIAGVAVAVSVGGAGAIFWMVVAGFLGMTAKFCECTLGVKYRKIDENGKVLGGAMYYLRDGLAEQGMKGVGKVLAVLFAIVCVTASFGAGNMFQVNQAAAIFNKITASEEHQVAKKNLIVVTKEKDSYLEMANALLKQQESSKSLRAQLTSFDESFSVKEEGLRAELLATETSVATLAEKVGDKSEHLALLDSKIEVLKNEVSDTKGFFEERKWAFGLIIAVLVGLVIIGGVKSIAKVTGVLVPVMCGIYVLSAFIILCIFVTEIPAAFVTIFKSAFGISALSGGLIGAFIQGIRRSAFSNEAGFGSAPIVHAAAKTKHAASEGLVALLEPFVDTVIVCTMTGLVIVVTGMHTSTEFGGIDLTAEAFSKGLNFFPIVLAVAAILFAISTMLSWCYYGQQAWAYLFGNSKAMALIFKIIFCVFIVLGASMSLSAVLDFSDGMFFFMCLFNLVGVWILYPVVKKELRKYKEFADSVDQG